MTRTAARVDGTQRAIVRALRQVGAAVLPLHMVGHGAPDALVARAGDMVLLEIKAGKGKLTPEQVAFHAAWPGRIVVVRTVSEALRAVGVST